MNDKLKAMTAEQYYTEFINWQSQMSIWEVYK